MSAVDTNLPLLRHGIRSWLRSWVLLIGWRLVELRLVLPVLVVLQGFMSVGAVVGVRLWFDTPPAGAGMFVTTGAATFALVTAGLVMAPQLVAYQRLRGMYDFQWSLPVPRSSLTAAALTANLAIVTPALVATIFIGAIVYDLNLSVTPSVVSAVLLTVGTAGLLGSALAYSVKNPRLVSVVSQTLIFAIFGFSPVLFPAANLPDWLAAVHEVLPFASMASVVRASLTHVDVGDLSRAYTVLAAWFTIGLAVTALAVGRRT